MSSLMSVKAKIKDEVNNLFFHVEFVPSKYGGTYKATHKELGIVCYGVTIEGALKNARSEAMVLSIMAGSLKRAIRNNEASLLPESAC